MLEAMKKHPELMLLVDYAGLMREIILDVWMLE